MKRILIIEDDSYFAALCEKGLKKYGYSVLRAGDGEEGLEMLEKERPDLVVLDIIMPRMNGLEVLKKIRQDQADVKLAEVPVIILTNLYQKNDVETGKMLKAKAYLVKAMTDIDQLVDEIKKVLNE